MRSALQREIDRETLPELQLLRLEATLKTPLSVCDDVEEVAALVRVVLAKLEQLPE